MRVAHGLMLAYLLFQNPGNAAAELVETKVERLVARLVSPNKEPPIPVQTPSYPPEYDRSAQNSVRKSFLDLQRLGRSALPYLVPHFGDDRYSLTLDTGAAYNNFSVGALCVEILDGHLQPYGTRRKEGLPRPSYIWHHRLDDPDNAEKWLESRKDKTMVELQLEVAHWVIEEEAKTPEVFDDEEREFMASVVRKLKKPGRPLPPSVPWSQ